MTLNIWSKSLQGDIDKLDKMGKELLELCKEVKRDGVRSNRTCSRCGYTSRG